LPQPAIFVFAVELLVIGESSGGLNHGMSRASILKKPLCCLQYCVPVTMQDVDRAFGRPGCAIALRVISRAVYAILGIEEEVKRFPVFVLEGDQQIGLLRHEIRVVGKERVVGYRDLASRRGLERNRRRTTLLQQDMQALSLYGKELLGFNSRISEFRYEPQ
jgi:hypothetical protein